VATELEDLRILQAVEFVSDSVWKQVVQWDEFARDVVGKQLARAVDSVGANIAESYGRFHYGEKLQFLYYSRGSLFESKYWLNRAQLRGLMQAEQAKDYAARLSDVARQLNTFASNLKSQRKETKTQMKSVSESQPDYLIAQSTTIFTDTELDWLETEP
jgi:four helix bundle protein